MPTFFIKQDIDYDGFKLFMNTYLETEIPEELCRHLFLSFVKRMRGPPLEAHSITVSKILFL